MPYSMNSDQQNHASMPFWDFIQSLDPNSGAGRGVDHNGPQYPNMANFPAGFPFGGPGHHGPQGPHGPHHGPPHGPPHGPAGPAPPGPPDANGAGFEWGPAAWFQGPAGPWAHHDRRGPHHHRGWSRHGMNPTESRGDEGRASTSDAEPQGEKEKNDSPDTIRNDVPDPAEVTPEDDEHEHPPHHRGCGRGRGRGRRGGCRGGRGGFQPGFRWGGPHQMPGAFPGAHPPPPPYSGQGAPFDFGGFLRGCANHPFFQNLRDQAQQRFQNPSSNDDDSFTPPVDVFSTERAYVLHVSLPGAKKEDIGVNWDGESGVLNIAGVVHRPGDEEFLSTLSTTERKVGMFERNVTLPPAGSTDRDEVDGFAITAKMEDGILIVTVPKVEKEWTEIHKIDIE